MKIDERLLILLDIDEIFDEEEMLAGNQGEGREGIA